MTTTTFPESPNSSGTSTIRVNGPAQLKPLMRVAGVAELLVRRLDDRGSSEEAVEWAVATLEAGYDTPNLRILAGLDAPFDLPEVEMYLGFVLEEVICAVPDPLSVRLAYAGTTARRMGTGQVEPQVGCRDIYQYVARPLNYPEELADWVHLDDGRAPEPPYSELQGAALDEEIVAAAGRLSGQLDAGRISLTLPPAADAPNDVSLRDRLRLWLGRLSRR